MSQLHGDRGNASRLVAAAAARIAGYGWGHMFWLLVPIAGIIVLIVFWSQPAKEGLPAAGATGQTAP